MLSKHWQSPVPLLVHAAVKGWSEVFKLELPKCKCLVTGKMLRRNLHAVITFPISLKLVKHHLSKIVRAHQLLLLFFVLVTFYFFKIMWYLKRCSIVVLNILPWFYFHHESLILKISYLPLSGHLSKWKLAKFYLYHLKCKRKGLSKLTDSLKKSRITRLSEGQRSDFTLNIRII